MCYEKLLTWVGNRKTLWMPAVITGLSLVHKKWTDWTRIVTQKNRKNILKYKKYKKQENVLRYLKFSVLSRPSWFLRCCIFGKYDWQGLVRGRQKLVACEWYIAEPHCRLRINLTMLQTKVSYRIWYRVFAHESYSLPNNNNKNYVRTKRMAKPD